MDFKNNVGRHDFIFPLLVVLVSISVTVSLLHLSGELNNIIVLGIAFVMAGLVAAQYMGLKWGERLLEVIIAIPLALFVLLVIVLLRDLAHFPV